MKLKPCRLALSLWCPILRPALGFRYSTDVCLLYLEVTQQGLQLAGGVLGVLVS